MVETYYPGRNVMGAFLAFTIGSVVAGKLYELETYQRGSSVFVLGAVKGQQLHSCAVICRNTLGIRITWEVVNMSFQDRNNRDAW